MVNIEKILLTPCGEFHTEGGSCGIMVKIRIDKNGI